MTPIKQTIEKLLQLFLASPYKMRVFLAIAAFIVQILDKIGLHVGVSPNIQHDIATVIDDVLMVVLVFPSFGIQAPPAPTAIPNPAAPDSQNPEKK